MRTTRFDIVTVARRLTFALGLSWACLFSIGACAQPSEPLSAAQLRMIDDLRLGLLGKDIDFEPGGAQMLMLGTTKIRQISADDDGDEVHWHFIDRFATDPDAMLLHYVDKASNVVIVYRVDAQFRFVRGYVWNNGQLTAVSDADGAAGVQAELLWWSRNMSVEMGKIRKRLGAGDKPEAIAKDYGVSAPTLESWVATIK